MCLQVHTNSKNVNDVLKFACSVPGEVKTEPGLNVIGSSD